jgi:hypothetical protein
MDSRLLILSIAIIIVVLLVFSFSGSERSQETKKCGDGVCDEDCVTCPKDCGVCPGTTCRFQGEFEQLSPVLEDSVTGLFRSTESSTLEALSKALGKIEDSSNASQKLEGYKVYATMGVLYKQVKRLNESLATFPREDACIYLFSGLMGHAFASKELNILNSGTWDAINEESHCMNGDLDQCLISKISEADGILNEPPLVGFSPDFVSDDCLNLALFGSMVKPLTEDEIVGEEVEQILDEGGRDAIATADIKTWEIVSQTYEEYMGEILKTDDAGVESAVRDATLEEKVMGVFIAEEMISIRDFFAELRKHDCA